MPSPGLNTVAASARPPACAGDKCGACRAQHLALALRSTARPRSSTQRQRPSAWRTVFHAIAVGTPLRCSTRALQQRQIIRVQARLEVAEHALHLFLADAEDALQVAVVNLVGLQVPVPQAQFAGLQRQGQTLLALAQAWLASSSSRVAGHAISSWPGLAQLAFGTAALSQPRAPAPD